ncbi:hydratase [Oscillibacter valericigenes]|uniref:hydratase n=1 Tax=Oscillibacter valericigenes TaxID=351091 RepID=UPI001F31E3D4|nr:hydratase [Oscillibacter valericigenes]MCF2664664.1 hydratase [Oscillibacter valericigenes]
MMTLHDEGIFLVNGALSAQAPVSPEEGRRQTMAWNILQAHNTSGDPDNLKIRFDAMLSHDITYVGIIQQARASGMKEFPIPYALTNCHNSLCAVGGTINEDDHVFGLSAAKKYGGIYVPANQSVIHSYGREQMAKCGAMILGSDSHTRYGALGTMAVGEGGPELAKQLLKNTWDVKYPKVVLVYLTGAPRHGIGPHDVAIALVKATFASGFVNNCVLEFAGPGIASLPIDFRNGIDVMTTETTCLSSIWETDGVTQGFYQAHQRPEDYRELHPGQNAYYDKCIELDLSKIESMIALPFHPSNAWTIHEFLENAEEILANLESDAQKRFPKAKISLMNKIHDGGVWADQGVIAGCAGGLFDNIDEAADILRGGSCGNGYFTLDVYPTSVPVSLELTKTGATAALLEAGAVIKPSFCGPCFGAGDVPSHNGLSLRHTTRNFPNREGSKPGEGQFAGVCLMDARSIAATARNGGRITAATDVDYTPVHHEYHFDKGVYDRRLYYGFGKADPSVELIMGPNITDWPKMQPLAENLLVELAAVLHDPVTTTDELIPSGETSSYRSNPLRLAEFTLSRREPAYVGRAKAVAEVEAVRLAGKKPLQLKSILDKVGDGEALMETTQFGSCVFANKPGDGSAREQAASCQKVLGGFANICYEFATKRYRSNCINWGILPFTIDKEIPFTYENGDCVFVPGIRKAIEEGMEDIPAKVIRTNGTVEDLLLHVRGLTADEKEIILDGCLMNYYAKRS